MACCKRGISFEFKEHVASIFHLPLNWYVILVLKAKVVLLKLFQSLKGFS